MTGNNFPALSKKPTPPGTPPATPRGWTATSPRRTDIVEGRQRTDSPRLSITNPEKPVKLQKPEPKPRDLADELVAWDGPPPDLPQSPSSKPLEIGQAEKPVSEKKPRAAQLKKHQATRSLDFQGVKAKAEKPKRGEEPPPREKRLMVDPAEKIRKTGKVSTSELIDGFVNGLLGVEGAHPIDEKFIDQLGQALSNHAIENELKPKFNSFGPKEIETALAKMRKMKNKITELGSGTPLYFACLVALEARQEALKAEPAKRAAIPKPSSLNLSKMADALADLGDSLAEGSKKVSKLISPRKLPPFASPRTLFASSTPKREPLPVEPSAPPAPEPDPKGVAAMADFISQRDREGMETSFDRLRSVLFLLEAHGSVIDSWIDAALKGKSREALDDIVAAVEKGFGASDVVFRDVQHRLTGRLWADMLVRQLLKNPDVNENAHLKTAYDRLIDYVVYDEDDKDTALKASALKVEPLFLRAIKELRENELETLAELPLQGTIDDGLKGALDMVRKKS
jgi:hypothetical protein